MKRFLPLFIILLLTAIFFKPLILQGKLPIPADTIVGLYYPYRDFYSATYPRGIPFKNFMITDPIRQQYPWKNLVIDVEKQFQLPLWDPYTFAGHPLLANLQSGALSPGNLLFFMFPFAYAWSFLILLQPLLAAFFLYLYLDNLKLDKRAAILGAITFAFGGFSISWLEWGIILNTALWLPLILLSIDKLLAFGKTSLNFSNKPLLKWFTILIASLTVSFLGGHLQFFFYTFIFAVIYLLAKIYSIKKTKMLILFLFAFLIFVLITAIVWIPSLKFILLSARGLDQNWHTIEGWFVPWQNLVQFIIPDFFGNPATLNYFGVWNYGEFISYIGITSAIFAVLALFRKDKKTLFFFLAFLMSLLFALPTVFAKIPYKFSLPLISTSQPTRLIFLADFSLSVLAALGFNYFLEKINKKKTLLVLLFLGIIFTTSWILVLQSLMNFSKENILVTRQNLILPSLLFFINAFVLIVMLYLPKKIKIYKKLFYLFSLFLIVILFADLLRFGWKYLSFSNINYLYPQTKTLNFLKQNLGNYRVMSSDSSIFPPNFSIMYKIQTLDGYDPLYLQRYGELMAALERGSSDIHSPFGFNRIITPQNYHSHLINLLGIKYVLSLNEINDVNFRKVFSEGNTKVYLNKKVLPRAYFVENTHYLMNKQDEINFLFKFQDDLSQNAVVEANDISKTEWSWYKSIAEITSYQPNSVTINTENQGEGFLVLTDTFYPTWHTTIDGKETKLYLTDYNFRGIIVPSGRHKIIFYDTLF